MTMREINYYQYPLDDGFVKHLREETGLSERDQKIAMLFRTRTLDTQGYAENAGVPLKSFYGIVDAIHKRLMAELFRLAYLGWLTEKNSKE